MTDSDLVIKHFKAPKDVENWSEVCHGALRELHGSDALWTAIEQLCQRAEKMETALKEIESSLSLSARPKDWTVADIARKALEE